MQMDVPIWTSLGLSLPVRDALAKIPTVSLRLSVRSHNCLKKGQFPTVGALVAHTPAQLLSIRNFGLKCLTEVVCEIKRVSADPGPWEGCAYCDTPGELQLSFSFSDSPLSDEDAAPPLHATTGDRWVQQEQWSYPLSREWELFAPGIPCPADLPVGRLDPTPALWDRLDELGLERIVELLPLDLTSLRERFGGEALEGILVALPAVAAECRRSRARISEPYAFHQTLRQRWGSAGVETLGLQSDDAAILRWSGYGSLEEVLALVAQRGSFLAWDLGLFTRIWQQLRAMGLLDAPLDSPRVEWRRLRSNTATLDAVLETLSPPDGAEVSAIVSKYRLDASELEGTNHGIRTLAEMATEFGLSREGVRHRLDRAVGTMFRRGAPGHGLRSTVRELLLELGGVATVDDLVEMLVREVPAGRWRARGILHLLLDDHPAVTSFRKGTVYCLSTVSVEQVERGLRSAHELVESAHEGEDEAVLGPRLAQWLTAEPGMVVPAGFSQACVRIALSGECTIQPRPDRLRHRLEAELQRTGHPATVYELSLALNRQAEAGNTVSVNTVSNTLSKWSDFQRLAPSTYGLATWEIGELEPLYASLRERFPGEIPPDPSTVTREFGHGRITPESLWEWLVQQAWSRDAVPPIESLGPRQISKRSPRRDLFAEVPSNLVALTSALAAAVEGLTPPRYLCEVCLSQQDVETLRDFLGGVPEVPVSAEWVPGAECTAPEGFGLLFLAFAAEAVRRDRYGGGVWRRIYSRVPDQSRAVLFTVLDSPRMELRAAIQAAASRFGLRHGFGVRRAHPWALTLQLQIALTRDEVEHLSAGARGRWSNEALDILLEPGGPTELRVALDAIRRTADGDLSSDELEADLDGNPWILPEWFPVLRESLLRKPDADVDVSDLESRAPGRAPDLPGQQPDVPEWVSDSGVQENAAADGRKAGVRFPRLRWSPPDEPYFELPVPDLMRFVGKAPHVDLHMNGVFQRRVLRQEDNTFEVPPFLRMRFGAGSAMVSADPGALMGETGVDGDGAGLSDESSQEYLLWDPQEDLNLFDLRTGRRIEDPWSTPIEGNRDYALLAAQDLDVAPNILHWQMVGPHHRIYFVKKEDLERVRVSLSGEPLWDPLLRSRRRPRKEPGWADGVIAMTCEKNPRLGAQIHIEVLGLPPESRVTQARILGQSVSIASVDEGTARLGPISLGSTSPGTTTIRLWIVAVDGTTTRLDRDIEVKPWGLLEQTESGSRPVSSADSLVVGDGRAKRVRLLPPPPPRGDTSDWTLFEGGTPIGSTRKAWHSIDFPDALGSSLVLHRRRWNIQNKGELVSGPVRHTGVVAKVLQSGSGEATLALHRQIEPGMGYQVAVWTTQGDVCCFDWDAIDVEEHCWRVEGVPALPFAAAVAFRGIRIGGWCFADAGTDLLLRGEDAVRIAGLVRWFRLPVLDPILRGAFRRWASQHAAACLGAWLAGSGCPRGLRWAPDDGERWVRAARLLLLDWHPRSLEEINDCIVALASDAAGDTERELPEAISNLHQSLSAILPETHAAGVSRALYDSCPLLAGKVLAGWADGLSSAQRRQSGTHLRVSLPNRRIPEGSLPGLEAALAEQIIGMGLRALREPLAPGRDLQNLLTALCERDFRHVFAERVARRILERLTHR